MLMAQPNMQCAESHPERPEHSWAAPGHQRGQPAAQPCSHAASPCAPGCARLPRLATVIRPAHTA